MTAASDDDGVNDKPTRQELDYGRPSQLDPHSQLRVLKQWFRDDSSHSAAWRTQAREDFDFKAGRQWSPEEKSQLNEQLRPDIVFNRTLTIIKAVAGFEINGRHEIQFLPRQIQDTQVNEVLTGASKWMADECDAEDEESEAFQDCATCGMGWCLSDDAMVRLPNTHFATTRLYTGSVIKIDLENGKQLTGTANHPVLTDRGWKRLHELKEGDNLVSSAFLERIKGLPIEQFDKVETRLKDKIDAFRAGREAAWVRTAPDDFYSDGRGSKVHVVYADGLLLRQFRYAALGQKLKQLGLAWRDFVSLAALTTQSLLASPRYAAIGQAPFGAVHLPRANLPSRNIVAQLVASVSKMAANSFRVGVKYLSDLNRGQFLREVHPSNVSHGKFAAYAGPAQAELIAARSESVLDATTRYSEYISDFRDWKPFLEVQARNLRGTNIMPEAAIVRVSSVFEYGVSDFPVHDVGTSLGFFIAGDIITSNTESRISYEQDGAGLYEEAEINPLEMYWDYRARKRNLVDARRMARLREVSLGEAKEMFPGHDNSDVDARWATGFEPEEQVKTIEEKRKREENAGDNFTERNDVYIVQMQWSERVPYWLVADEQTQKKIELPDKQFQVLRTRMHSMGMKLVAVKIFKREYFQAFIGAKVLECGPAPNPERFTFRSITGEQDKNKGTWFGLVRMMRDPQKWANKWLSQTLHIMNANAKGGILAEPDAFDDQRQAEESYARTETITWVKKGALSAANPKFMPKPTATFPAGFFNLLEFAISSLRDVTGINLELLGQKDVNQPGVLEAQRKQAGMTVLATMFDSLRRYRKEIGRIRLYYIQHFLSDGRLVRITGQDGAKVIPLLRDKCLGEYDVIVDDAPTSPNQKQANWAIVAPLLPVFKDQLMQNPEVLMEVLQFSPLPSRLIEAIRGVMTKVGPAQQMQEKMQQLEIAKRVAAINKDQSTAEMQDAKAGATQATAAYDLAMAQNLLLKHRGDMAKAALEWQKAQRETEHSGLDAAHKVAQIDETKARAEKTRADTINTHADTANTHADTAHTTVSALIDALSPLPTAQPVASQ